MRIAVVCAGLDVASRYETCDSFMCYLIDHGIITGCQNMPNIGISVPDMIETTKELDIQVLIVNTINFDVAAKFCDAGIEVVAGVEGSARKAVENYLSKSLMDADYLCHPDDEDDADSQEVDGPDAAASADEFSELEDAIFKNL